jgi:glucose/arabinose dehydrogenase
MTVGGLVLIPVGSASATTVSGFVNNPIATDFGPLGLTNFAFLPSGDLFIISKCGGMERVGIDGTKQAMLDLGVSIPCSGDRGLVGIDIAPDFSSSGIVYLLYDYNGTDGRLYGKLARWKVDDPAAATSIAYEGDLLNGLPSFSTQELGNCDDSHTVGSVLVAPDGTLFVGNGDASSYCTPDPQALDAQNITTPRGKIFHITSTGAGVPSNPFYQASAPTSWQSRVYAYGFRNPFRFTLKPGSSTTLYVGDVGFDTYEEVDVVTAGGNYGWPCYEGPFESSFHPGFPTPDFNTYALCQNLYAHPSLTKRPLVYWSHDSVGGQSAVIGGAFYAGVNYPAAYQGAFFFGDYANSHIWTIQTDPGDTLIRAPENGGFASGSDAEAPVAFHMGPDGDLYWADIVSSTIFHLQNATSPVAVATADVSVGAAPLAVHFDGSKSGVPSGDGIAYAWDFGDGTPGSNDPKPTHTYAGSGHFTATLTITDTTTGATDTATVAINTANHVPVVSVALSPPGLTYAVGDVVTVRASATDAEDGPIPPRSLTFQTLLHHCPVPNACHIHPGQIVTGTNGTYSFVFPNHGNNVWDEIVVTATDSQGASSRASVAVNAANAVFSAVTPYRLLDTRLTGPLTPGRELVLNPSDQHGIPAQPSGVLLNVTVTNPAAAGYVRAFPCGTSPYISTVNFDEGQTVANLASVRLRADKRVCFATTVRTDLVVDVAGWYSLPYGAPEGAAYTPITPTRILDTRQANMTPTGVVAPLMAGREYSFTLAGRSGFPSTARAALLNLTVTNPQAAGYLRAYPCGAEQNVSNVDYSAGQTVANLAAVEVAPGGRICFRSYASTDLVVDLSGWYATAGGYEFSAPQPARIFDTRDPRTSPFGAATPLLGGQELPVRVGGSDGVPTGARALVLNVTAANPSAKGYVRVYPCGTSPFVSNLNYGANQVAVANLAVVKLPTDGRVCFSSFATTDLVVDLAGWYAG